MPFRITVDKDKCIGCHACANSCPSMFRMVDGKSEPVKPVASEPGCSRQAASECPVDAISVKEEK